MQLSNFNWDLSLQVHFLFSWSLKLNFRLRVENLHEIKQVEKKLGFSGYLTFKLSMALKH